MSVATQNLTLNCAIMLGGAQTWDVATGRLLRIFAGHAEAAVSVAFAPDGRRIVSGSNDKTIKVWDAASGELVRSLVGHQAMPGQTGFGGSVNRKIL